MKNFILVFFIMPLMSCASYFKKKECEQANWFEQGERIALSGKWLKADEFVSTCRQAEANISESQLDQGFKSGKAKYCHPDNAKIVGRKGEILNESLCDGPESLATMKSYQQGIAQYCAASNGFLAGQSGVVYNHVCPQNLEPEFMIEYKKGRTSYLQNRIQNEQLELNKMQSQLDLQKVLISNLQNQESGIEAQITNNNTLMALATENASLALKTKLQGEAAQLQQKLDRVRADRQEAVAKKNNIENSIESIESNLFNYKKELDKLN